MYSIVFEIDGNNKSLREHDPAFVQIQVLVGILSATAKKQTNRFKKIENRGQTD